MMNGKKPDWFPDWENQYVALIGAGGSVRRDEVESLRGRIKVMAINQSYELCLWADALYSCDAHWWRHAKGAPKFAGIKITHDPLAVKEFPDIKKVSVKPVNGASHQWSHDLHMEEYGVIGGGGHSGFQTVNLCAQWKVKGMMLLGFDLCVIGNKLHWHGNHPFGLNNPNETNFSLWKSSLEKAAPKLGALGIEVINCSMQSALGCYPRMSVSETLERWNL